MAYLDKAITKLDVSSTGNQYFTFVNSSIGGPEDLKVNANIAFNPSLNTFIVEGNLIVNGTTTTLGTQDLVVEDKNIIIGNVGTPSDTTADGGGITLKGTTDKTFNWVDSTDSWTSSENINLATGKIIKINGANILSATNAYVTANYSVDSDKLDGQHATYFLNITSTINAGNISGTIPSAVLGNSNIYIGNTAVALNRGTGLLSLTGVNIDGNAGYATTAGSTINSITAGNGITGSTFNGGSAQTWSIVSAAGSAGTIGTISVAADTVGVSLGTTSTVAAAGDHGHGNILTGGTITAAAVTAANTDYILISDASNSGKIEKSIAIGTGTTTYLRNDGTWASPPDTNTDTLQSISNIATAGTYYPSFVSTTGAVVGYVAQDKLTFNPSTGTLTTTYLSGALISGVTTVTASTYTADKAYPIILADATTPASITISLPAAASSNGLVFRIKKIDGSAHQVIIDANGTELIDGAETFTLIYQYQAVDLACNGTAWYIL